jgi:hypothetical protein
LATEALEFADPSLQGLGLGWLARHEGRLAARFVFAPPAQQEPLGEAVLTANLGWAFLAAYDLPDDA